MGKQQNKRQAAWIRRVLTALLLALAMAGAVPLQSYAASVPSQVKNSKSSVLQVIVYYQDEEGMRYTLQTGSCFAVNRQLLATCAHVVQVSEEELSQIAGACQISEEEAKENIRIGVICGNTWIDASVLAENTGLDAAILRLPVSLPSSRNALRIRNCQEMHSKDACYAVGYPGSKGDPVTGIVPKAEVTAGKVLRCIGFLDSMNYYYLENTASIESGDSGGALLDQEGFVVGIIKAVGISDDGEKRYYAVMSEDLQDMLDSGNYAYTRESRKEEESDGILYQITDYQKKTACVKDSWSGLRSASIKSTIRIEGRTYKVTSIKKNAFKNHKYLKSVTIGKNVKEIGSRAFYGCKNLNKLTIKTQKLSTVSTRAIKGIRSRAVIRVPKGKVNAYRRLFSQAGGVKSTMKFTAK